MDTAKNVLRVDGEDILLNARNLVVWKSDLFIYRAARVLHLEGETGKVVN